MPFRRGPEINPFKGSSQEPMDLLESITPMELASCVPFVKIVKIDPRNGKPATDVRPLMFDLVQTPQFGSVGDDADFGVDRETFRERALVSLAALRVETKLSYGLLLFKEVTLQFTVHHPGLVFDRFSKVPWREILEEGVSFSLEYGWTADPALVKNDLFNGNGHVTQSGQVFKSTQTALLIVQKYQLRVRQTGEVEVMVHALENSDIALREARFSDSFEGAFAPGTQRLRAFLEDRTGAQLGSSDQENARRLKVLLDSIPPIQVKGRGVMHSLGDVLDSVVAPMVDAAARGFGYVGQPELLLANFNARAGRQSDPYGGRDMAGRSIGEFLVPATKLREVLSGHFASGRSMVLQNFINYVVNIANAVEAWGQDPREDRAKPELVMRTDTVRTDTGVRLVVTIYDRKVTTDVFRESDRLPLDSQTREKVMEILRSKGVPVLEFARAGTLVIDANFELQPDPLLQAIQVDAAYRDRKDRVQQTQMPDVESRRGQARPHEIVPASILEGDVTMYGNFVLETFGLIWVEFFRSSTISGVFHALEKTDMVEPGKFTSRIKLISEGLDPMNTRRRLTDAEIAEANERARKLRGKK